MGDSAFDEGRVFGGNVCSPSIVPPNQLHGIMHIVAEGPGVFMRLPLGVVVVAGWSGALSFTNDEGP